MNGTVAEFQQSLTDQPAQKAKRDGHYCAPRVKSPLLDRILKLGGKEMPKTDKEFWEVAPRVNEFILRLIDEKVTELEAEVAAEKNVKERAKS